jgi:glyoxylase-like metal-dependent hydrolase (beta-lactamase superfamily II)
VNTSIRQLFDGESSTYTYLIIDEATRAAALVDPVREKLDRDLGLVADLGLHLALVLETHVHADHVTSAGELRRRTGAQTVASHRGAACVDRPVRHGDTITLGETTIDVLETPGHTDDGLTYRVGADLFTGDTLLVRGCGRSDFQNGDAGALYDAITETLFAFDDATRVWPGHDYKGFTMTTIGEERRHNPRVAGRSRPEFIALMGALGLPPPKKLAEAVPANLACGEPAGPR